MKSISIFSICKGEKMKHMFSFLASFSLFCSVFAGQSEDWIQEYFVPVPNFPKPGINFICYTDVLKDPDAFHRIIQKFADRYQGQDLDAIVGLDARGFIFGAALAYELKLPFVMVRKAGKLPRKTQKIDYHLEYGSASFEIELESLDTGDRVVVVDDVLATGGTADAAATLIESVGATVVEGAFLVELSSLKGRERFNRPVYALTALDDKVVEEL